MNESILTKVVKFVTILPMNTDKFQRLTNGSSHRRYKPGADPFDRLGRQRNTRYVPLSEARPAAHSLEAAVVSSRHDRIAFVSGRLAALRAQQADVVIGNDGAFAGDLFTPQEKLAQARRAAEPTHYSTIEGRLAKLAVWQAFDAAYPELTAGTPTDQQPQQAWSTPEPRNWFDAAAVN